MSRSREQVGRLLALVPLISRKGELHVTEAAEMLGVSPRQLVKDLYTLVFCGLPGLMPGDLIEIDFEALEPDGDGMIRISNADYLTAPMRLAPSEVSALIVALRTLRDSATVETHAPIDSALAKLEAVVQGSAPVATVHLRENAAQLATLRANLAEAIHDGRRLRLTYLVPSRDEETTREADPLAVVSSAGVDYLDAWCYRADERRSFRLDRILHVDVLDVPIVTHDLAPLDLSEGIFRPSAETPVATLRLEPAARWVAEYYPTTGVRELPGGRLEVDLPVADERWLIQMLLRLAPYAEVVGPSEFDNSYREAAMATRSLYG